MARECQEKNSKGLTMVAVGMNKAAEELMILDDRTQADLASGKYHDQRRGSFGTSAPAAAAPRTTPAAQTTVAPRAAATPRTAPATPDTRGSQPSARESEPSARHTGQPSARGSKPSARQPGQPSARRGGQPSARRPAGSAARGRPWTERQERLALLYNEQGLRPDEIAVKLGVSTYTATQIILAARHRARA